MLPPLLVPLLLLLLVVQQSASSAAAITALNFNPVEYSLPLPPNLEGPLASNARLTNAQLLVKGNVTGPESVHVEDGGQTLYTTTLDGKVVKIVDGQIVRVLRIRQNATQTCGTYDTEPLCGRPLGIRRLDAQHLVVADAYLGLYKVEFDNGTVEQLVSANQQLAGAKCAFFNDLDVLNNGTTIFFSCTSTRWDRRRFMHDFLEGQPTGSLVKFDVPSGQTTVVVKKLNFANGVQVHPDQQSVLVNECSRARIVRYYFDGPKKGKSEIFADNLPGFPDNIRLSFNGTSFFVAMAAVRHSQLITFVDKLGPFPWLRFAANQFFPESGMATFFMANLLKRQGFVLELGLDGKAIGTYQDPSGSVISSVSEASDDANFLYLGSIFADFIAKVPKAV